MFRYGQSLVLSLAVTEFALKSNFWNYFLQKIIRSYTITPSLTLCLSSWSLCCSCGWLWVWIPALEVQRRVAQTSSSSMPAECPQSPLTKVWHSPNDRTLWSEDIILFFEELGQLMAKFLQDLKLNSWFYVLLQIRIQLVTCWNHYFKL